MPTAQSAMASCAVALRGGFPAHLRFPALQDRDPVAETEVAWGWLGAYAMPLATCAVLILLCYRYRTSTRAPHGLRRAARFEHSCDRVLLTDAFLVALGTPLVLFFCLALWFFPADVARHWPGNHDDPIRFATTALAFAGAAMASGWLAPESTTRLFVSGVGIAVALLLPGLTGAEQLQLAAAPALALVWFAFVFPFARPAALDRAAHRFRPAALIGALLLCIVSTVPLVAVRCGPADTPLMAATVAAER